MSRKNTVKRPWVTSGVGVTTLRPQDVEPVFAVQRKYWVRSIHLYTHYTYSCHQPEEEWMYWCEVEDGEECEDIKDGRSFAACQTGEFWPSHLSLQISYCSGCPHAATVAHAESQNDNNLLGVLHDNCDDDGGEWIAPNGAVDDDAALVLDIICPQKITTVLVKNLLAGQGGTKEYTIYIGSDLDGPWELMHTGEMNQTDSCQDSLEVIRIKKE